MNQPVPDGIGNGLGSAMAPCQGSTGKLADHHGGADLATVIDHLQQNPALDFGKVGDPLSSLHSTLEFFPFAKSSPSSSRFIQYSLPPVHLQIASSSPAAGLVFSPFNTPPLSYPQKKKAAKRGLCVTKVDPATDLPLIGSRKSKLTRWVEVEGALGAVFRRSPPFTLSLRVWLYCRAF